MYNSLDAKQRGRGEKSCRLWCAVIQGSCHLETKASGQCALLSTCTDLVSGYIDLLSWLFMVMCVGMLEFAGKGTKGLGLWPVANRNC